MSRTQILRGVTAALLVLSACEDALAPVAEPEPACTDPAPLVGEYDPRAPGYLVMFHSGIDAAAETERLAIKYGFEPRYVFPVTSGFSADLDSATLAALRCEPTVSYVAYNAIVETAVSTMPVGRTQ
jgi:hypothetical protein